MRLKNTSIGPGTSGDNRKSRARLGIVCFNDRAFVRAVPVDPYQPWLQKRILGLPEYIGGTSTNIADGLREAVRMLTHPSVPPWAVRECWLLSDGESNRETAALPEVISSAIAATVTVHTIAFGAQADAALLRQIAESTGGKLVSVREVEELTATLVALVRDGAPRNQQRRHRVTVFAIDTSLSMTGARIDAVVKATLHLTRDQQLAYV